MKLGLIYTQRKRSHKGFTTWTIKVQLLLWSTTCIKSVISLYTMASDHFVAEITLSMDEMLILTKPSGQTCPRGWSKVRPKAVWCPARGLLRSRGHKWFVKQGPTQRANWGTWIRFMSDKYILISVFTRANVDDYASPISKWKFIRGGCWAGQWPCCHCSSMGSDQKVHGRCHSNDSHGKCMGGLRQRAVGKRKERQSIIAN